MKPIILTVAISTLLSQAIAQTRAYVTEAGIYTTRGSETVSDFASGRSLGTDSFTLVQSTTNIPARIGTVFGFRYTIRGTPTNWPVLLTMVVEHPPYKNLKTGKTQTRDEYKVRSYSGQRYTPYRFDYEWELIPGRFKFEVWHGDKKLCEQSFMVVPDRKPRDGI